MIGETISHYKILEKLSGGVKGAVYKAEDTKLRRAVALGFLPPSLSVDTTAKSRLIHEAQAASALQHNDIWTILAISETEVKGPFVGMDAYEGKIPPRKNRYVKNHVSFLALCSPENRSTPRTTVHPVVRRPIPVGTGTVCMHQKPALSGNHVGNCFIDKFPISNSILLEERKEKVPMKKQIYSIVLGSALGLLVSGCERFPNSVEHPSSEQHELSTMMKTVQAGSVELEMCVSFDSETETYIFSLAVYDGKLYAGTHPGGCIYVFDGTAWSLAFDTETQTHVWSLAVYDNKLYAGTEPDGLVYVYDGTSWSLAFDSPEFHINSLAVYDGKLYAGTWARGKIYVYDGTSWNQSADVFAILSVPTTSSHVFALAEYNGKLYAGTDVFPSTSGGPSGGLIFVYDGSSWSLALDTDEDQIRSLTVYDGKLFAGTYPSGKIYVFDGTSWGITFDSQAKCVYSLAVYNNNLYAGTATFGVLYGFDGMQWTTAFDSPENALFSLITYAGSLYAGTAEEGRVYGPCVTITDIDIKPGSDANFLDCRNDNGVVTVAILTTSEFNATQVDHTTVHFGNNGTEASEYHVDKKTGEQKRHEEDIDGDGDIDLIVHFRFGDTGLECGDEVGILTGETFDGQKIRGSDSIQTVGD